MNSSQKYSIQQLDENKHLLAEYVTDIQFSQHPELEERYGEEGRQHCYKDAIYHLDYLVQAMKVESRAMFTHYLEWAFRMLDAREIPKRDLMNQLTFMKEAVQSKLSPDSHKLIEEYLDAGVEHLRNLDMAVEQHLNPENPLYEEASEYLELLLSGKRRQAAELIDELVKSGVEVINIYEHIFQAVQYEVGALWQRNEITVAHEHYCTAATQLIMSRLYPLIFSGNKKGNRLVACSVSNELHEIGIRMVSDFFEMDGWDTYYLGSNMPDTHLLQSVREHEAHVLAISVTLPIHIDKVQKLIQRVKEKPEFEHLKIMVGGYPFTIIPDLCERLGANATAENARQAVATANELVI